MILIDDHEPAHVHVFSGRAQVKIRIDAVEPGLVENEGMKRGDLAKAKRLVSRHRLFLRKRWADIHG